MRKRLFIWITVFVLFVFLGAASIYKLDSIYRIAFKVRNNISCAIESRYMHKQKVSLFEYEPLQDEKNAWYTKYHFIAHAGGCSRWAYIYE